MAQCSGSAGNCEVAGALGSATGGSSVVTAAAATDYHKDKHGRYSDQADTRILRRAEEEEHDECQEKRNAPEHIGCRRNAERSGRGHEHSCMRRCCGDCDGCGLRGRAIGRRDRSWRDGASGVRRSTRARKSYGLIETALRGDGDGEGCCATLGDGCSRGRSDRKVCSARPIAGKRDDLRAGSVTIGDGYGSRGCATRRRREYHADYTSSRNTAHSGRNTGSASRGGSKNRV